jgi:hypothetical protein
MMPINSINTSTMMMSSTAAVVDTPTSMKTIAGIHDRHHHYRLVKPPALAGLLMALLLVALAATSSSSIPKQQQAMVVVDAFSFNSIPQRRCRHHHYSGRSGAVMKKMAEPATSISSSSSSPSLWLKTISATTNLNNNTRPNNRHNFLVRLLHGRRNKMTPEAHHVENESTTTTTTPLTAAFFGIGGVGTRGGGGLSKPLLWSVIGFWLVRNIVDAVIGLVVSLQITAKLQELADENAEDEGSRSSTGGGSAVNDNSALEVVAVVQDTNSDASDSKPVADAGTSLYDQYIHCISTKTPFSLDLLKVLDDEIFSQSWKARRVRRRFVTQGMIVETVK